MRFAREDAKDRSSGGRWPWHGPILGNCEPLLLSLWWMPESWAVSQRYVTFKGSWRLRLRAPSARRFIEALCVELSRVQMLREPFLQILVFLWSFDRRCCAPGTRGR
jgi:hypothetical protein